MNTSAQAVRAPAGFKNSDVGVIPTDWTVTPLGLLVSSIAYGSSAKSRSNGKIPVLRMGNLQDGKLIWGDLVYTEDAGEIARYSLVCGDVLFNRTNTVDLVGKAALYNGERPAIYAGYLIRVRTDRQRLDPRYLNYVLNAEFSRKYSLKVLSQAVGQANINGQKLKTYPIPLPPTQTEQECIAEALGDADASIESLEQLIAKKLQIKQGAMQELLTCQRRLPGFGGQWGTYCFGDLFSVVRNASSARSELSEDGDVAYVHYGDVHTHLGAFLDVRSKGTYIGRDRVRSIPRLSDGDLLMVDASEDTDAIGKAVEIEDLNGQEAVAGLHTIALRGKPERIVDGFKGYLQYMPQVRGALIRLATGVSVYGVTKSGVRAIEVTIPEPVEQTAISIVLKEMEAELNSLLDKLTKARQLKQAMMQELLTGRVRLV